MFQGLKKFPARLFFRSAEKGDTGIIGLNFLGAKVMA
jgi:hypothetical protein